MRKDIHQNVDQNWCVFFFCQFGSVESFFPVFSFLLTFFSPVLLRSFMIAKYFLTLSRTEMNSKRKIVKEEKPIGMMILFSSNDDTIANANATILENHFWNLHVFMHRYSKNGEQKRLLNTTSTETMLHVKSYQIHSKVQTFHAYILHCRLFTLLSIFYCSFVCSCSLPSLDFFFLSKNIPSMECTANIEAALTHTYKHTSIPSHVTHSLTEQ